MGLITIHRRIIVSYTILLLYNIFIYKKNAFNLGETSLILAAMEGHTDIVKTLLELRADVNFKRNDG